MADCVPGAWVVSTERDCLVMYCDVTVDTATHDCYTLKTPARTIDPTRAWTLTVNQTEVQIDGTALPVDIWAGYDDDFALDGDDSITFTSGYEVASAVMNDVKYNQLTITLDPNYNYGKAQSTITGSKVGHRNVATAPYYIINCDGASAFSGAVTVRFVIVQDQKEA